MAYRQREGAEDDDFNKYEDYLDKVAGREVDADGNISDENVTEEGIAKRIASIHKHMRCALCTLINIS